MINERFFYSTLTKEEKKVYRAINNGVFRHDAEITVHTDVDVKRVQDIFFLTLRDVPGYFYVDQRHAEGWYRTGEVRLTPKYIYDEKESLEYQRKVVEMLQKLEPSVAKFGGNQFRTEKFLHDLIVRNVVYDYESLDKDDQYDAHSIIGPFFRAKGVCEGMAKAFKLLCNYFGIKCMVVIGDVKAKENNIKASEKGSDLHAWNIVKINDKSYHVDVTWDNHYNYAIKHISYDYFNLTTEDILRDHTPNHKIPRCEDNDLNYFVFTGSVISDHDMMKAYLKKNYGKKKIVFKLSEDYAALNSGSKATDMIFRILYSAIPENGKLYKYVMYNNKEQRVYRLLRDDTGDEKN